MAGCWRQGGEGAICLIFAAGQKSPKAQVAAVDSLQAILESVWFVNAGGFYPVFFFFGEY
jgi:hypothetical protein